MSHWILACIAAFIVTYTATHRARQKQWDEDIDQALRLANEEAEEDDD